ncbi:hypothetical protein GIW70_01870 [Pseudomonas syringae]|nr:hypothetical protein [Pseudomonas syringae]MCF5066944.1 hypothetical protein [Pseudomonas syringae]
MRWLFLLLVVLNVFYYVWHQQEAPLRAKDVTPLNLYRGSQQDIRLLSESDKVRERSDAKSNQCLFVGGLSRLDMVQVLMRRLADIGVRAQPSRDDSPESGRWLQIAPESRGLLGDIQLQNLSKEFNELKHKIMQCEGVAPAE